MHIFKDWQINEELLHFKQEKGKFNRADALRIKTELRRLACR